MHVTGGCDAGCDAGSEPPREAAAPALSSCPQQHTALWTARPLGAAARCMPRRPPISRRQRRCVTPIRLGSGIRLASCPQPRHGHCHGVVRHGAVRDCGSVCDDHCAGAGIGLCIWLARPRPPSQPALPQPCTTAHCMPAEPRAAGARRPTPTPPPQQTLG